MHEHRGEECAHARDEARWRARGGFQALQLLGAQLATKSPRPGLLAAALARVYLPVNMPLLSGD